MTGWKWLLVTVPRLKLVATAAIAVALLAAPAAASAHNPYVYEVDLSLNKVRYWSNQTLFTSHLHEQDDFSALTSYHDFKVPRKGQYTGDDKYPGTSPFISPLADADTDWHGYGDNPDTSYDCKGSVVAADDGLLRASSKKHAVALSGELTASSSHPFFILGAVGTETYGGSRTCGQTWNGKDGLVPATTWMGLMPKMLTAKAQVSLADLRKLNVGQEYKTPELTEKDAQGQVPSDCSTSGITCDEHLDWKGHIAFTRTK